MKRILKKTWAVLRYNLGSLLLFETGYRIASFFLVMQLTHRAVNFSLKKQEFSYLTAENFELVSSIFKQLSDPTRIRIFWILCHCEECVINISAMMEMSSPAVAHHLRLLRSSGLIESRRDGKETYYRASLSRKAQTLHKMIEEMMEISCIQL